MAARMEGVSEMVSAATRASVDWYCAVDGLAALEEVERVRTSRHQEGVVNVCWFGSEGGARAGEVVGVGSAGVRRGRWGVELEGARAQGRVVCRRVLGGTEGGIALWCAV